MEHINIPQSVKFGNIKEGGTYSHNTQYITVYTVTIHSIYSNNK